jgi:hypothetical protein
MKAIAGVFASTADAQSVARKLRTAGLPADQLVLLHPGEDGAVPVTTAEQPGMAAALGGTVAGAAGAAGGLELGTFLAAVVPGIGPVLVAGFVGAALFGLAGVGVGATVGQNVENFLSEGLPEDELYVYEDALRQGRSVVVAFVDNEQTARSVRAAMKQEGAETIDAARDKWWIGLRDVEKEHYAGDFYRDEIFYRMGFQAALHARTRGKEYDQVLSEMAQDLEILKKRYPDCDVEKPFELGYERGRAYYEALRNRN